MGLFLFVHDGHNLHDEAEDYEYGSPHESLSVEHGGVEDVGVVAAAAGEEYVPQGEDDDADTHEDVVYFAEGELDVVVFFHDCQDLYKAWCKSVFCYIAPHGDGRGEVGDDDAHDNEYDGDEEVPLQVAGVGGIRCLPPILPRR